MKKKLKIFCKRIYAGGFKKTLPVIYVFGLILSFILALFWLVIPAFEICITMFAENLCAPVGFYTGLILSIPGYIVLSVPLTALPTLNLVVSLSLVVAASYFIYFLIGYFVDEMKIRDNYGKVKLISISAIVVLSYFLLMLINA